MWPESESRSQVSLCSCWFPKHQHHRPSPAVPAVLLISAPRQLCQLCRVPWVGCRDTWAWRQSRGASFRYLLPRWYCGRTKKTWRDVGAEGTKSTYSQSSAAIRGSRGTKSSNKPSLLCTHWRSLGCHLSWDFSPCLGPLTTRLLLFNKQSWSIRRVWRVRPFSAKGVCHHSLHLPAH